MISSHSLRRAICGDLAPFADFRGSWSIYRQLPRFKLRGWSARYYTCGFTDLSTTQRRRFVGGQTGWMGPTSFQVRG